jgi:hypothetical protein
MRPVTRWRTRTAITGAADEGISGYEQYRDDLVLTYFPTMDLDTARLAAIRMVPLRIRKFQLQRASPEDAAWLRSRFNECSAAYGCRTTALDDRSFALQWGVRRYSSCRANCETRHPCFGERSCATAAVVLAVALSAISVGRARTRREILTSFRTPLPAFARATIARAEPGRRRAQSARAGRRVMLRFLGCCEL